MKKYKKNKDINKEKGKQKVDVSSEVLQYIVTLDDLVSKRDGLIKEKETLESTIAMIEDDIKQVQKIL